jgi:transcriptional regulator with XRE-family HTH domain
VGRLATANVRAERARRRWSQSHLGALLGTSQTAVSQIEAGRRKLSMDDLISLCAALQVPLAQLLLGADHRQLQALGLPVALAEATTSTSSDRRADPPSCPPRATSRQRPFGPSPASATETGDLRRYRFR